MLGSCRKSYCYHPHAEYSEEKSLLELTSNFQRPFVRNRFKSTLWSIIQVSGLVDFCVVLSGGMVAGHGFDQTQKSCSFSDEHVPCYYYYYY